MILIFRVAVRYNARMHAPKAEPVPIGKLAIFTDFSIKPAKLYTPFLYPYLRCQNTITDVNTAL